ncbi:interferon a3-like [Salvelinus fontinalis]|uniref:interferon a3-like n=1 Tax=Salvelinus fontinalis TaxID=8038 RepID=UPI0024862178|nr:interferon a3-like [Salvelinus fontinalis]
MAVLKWLSICLTLFCQGTAASTPCNWTQFRLGKLNDLSIDLLSDMGGLFPLKCVEENVELFPEDVYKNTEGEDVSVVALEAMRYVDQLYNNSLTPVTWNKTELNRFQNVIYRQVHNLELCVVGGGWKSSGDGGSVTLKTYFNKLNTVLKDKEHSACAWEIVRKEIRENLVQFKKFIDSRVKP